MYDKYNLSNSQIFTKNYINLLGPPSADTIFKNRPKFYIHHPSAFTPDFAKRDGKLLIYQFIKLLYYLHIILSFLVDIIFKTLHIHQPIQSQPKPVITRNSDKRSGPAKNLICSSGNSKPTSGPTKSLKRLMQIPEENETQASVDEPSNQ